MTLLGLILRYLEWGLPKKLINFENIKVFFAGKGRFYF